MRLRPMSATELDDTASSQEAGIGTLATHRGNLPLDAIDVTASITGLTARVQVSQSFRNQYDEPLEATYVFPLPDRAAVTALRMEAGGRVVAGVLQERGQARADYQQAISEGRRASIAEEERPDVFTLRVGNIAPGEVVTVRLTLDQPLPYADGAATFRFPLVVAPRYVPGATLGGDPVGDGYSPDTDATPDASRITPPVLLPGFPNPVALSLQVDIDPGGLPLHEVRSSLHAVRTTKDGGRLRLSLQPGERADRDFVLFLEYGLPEDATRALLLVPDSEPHTGPDTSPDTVAGTESEGTFQLTVLPPVSAAPPRPRDVVLLLDRSGSMGGWKMVAARRAAARMVDTLTSRDRFAVLAFDHAVERPAGLPGGLVAGTDRNRYRAVEHLARTEARGGTELLAPLTEATTLLAASGDEDRDRVLVLVTDGQVGNEDQLVASLAGALAGIRVHTVGIDRAVNAGFLTRLAILGGGRCELVESEDRLDQATEHLHRRICQPLVTDLRLVADGLTVVDGTVAPARLPALFPGVALVITGRWRGAGQGSLTLSGSDASGHLWSITAHAAQPAGAAAVRPLWARAHLRDLEDQYLVAGPSAAAELERRIVATSLGSHVLCRFTAYVALDSRVVTDGSAPRQVLQPVEPVSGWDLLASATPGRAAPAPSAAPVAGGGPIAAAASAPAPAPPRRAPLGSRPILSASPSPQAAAQRPWRARATTPEPATAQATDPLEVLRTQTAEELRRLRETPAGQRLTALIDVGDRLRALMIRLGCHGEHATGPLRQLSELAEALRQADPDTVDQLWSRALAELAAFAKAAGAGRRRLGTFWKR